MHEIHEVHIQRSLFLCLWTPAHSQQPGRNNIVVHGIITDRQRQVGISSSLLLLPCFQCCESDRQLSFLLRNPVLRVLPDLRGDTDSQQCSYSKRYERNSRSHGLLDDSPEQCGAPIYHILISICAVPDVHSGPQNINAGGAGPSLPLEH